MLNMSSNFMFYIKYPIGIGKNVADALQSIIYLLYNYVPRNPLLSTLIISVLLMLITVLIRRIKYKTKNALGIIPINEIKDVEDIINEIHYAACYCQKNPELISRCKQLLNLYPAACNFPMREHNYTPFLRACWNGCTELIMCMISHGANVHATNETGEGAVYLATYSLIKRRTKSFSALKVLLDLGLDINQARADGYTAIHLAASRGHTRLVCWLIAHGANPCPPGRPSAAQIARAAGYPKLAEILLLPN